MERYAISETQIMSTWRAQCDRYDQAIRRNMARVLVVAAIVAISIFAFGVASPTAYIPPLLFGCGFYFFILRIFWASILMCPRCNEPPLPVGKYSHPRSAVVCEHCGSHLVSRLGT